MALGVTTLVLERDGVPVPLWLALQRLIPNGMHLAEIDGVAVLVDNPVPMTFDRLPSFDWSEHLYTNLKYSQQTCNLFIHNIKLMIQ